MSILKLETPRAFLPLLKPSRYKGAYGGRGSGKSHFFAELLIERAILQPGLRAVCVREIQERIKQSVKRLIEDKIAALGVGSIFKVQEKLIETPGNGMIIFQGMQNHTAESIKSLEGYDVAWVEEAQALSGKSLDMLRPTIRKPKSELWFSWNPTRENDPVDVMLRGKQMDLDPSLADDYDDWAIVREVNYTDNPWFPAVLQAELESDKRRDPEKYAHIWLGQYQQRSEARVFKNWRIGLESEFNEPDRFYYGADWGFSIDPTVLVRCYVSGRTLYVDREVYKVGCKIEDTPALFDTIDNGHARHWPVIADSARPETIAHMRDHGYTKMVPAKKGAGSVEEGIEFLKNYDIVVHPSCKNTIDELSLYSYETDKRTQEVLPKLADKKNHVIDALRYSVENLRRANPSPSIGLIHVPAPERERVW